jgi:hypothetical protein
VAHTRLRSWRRVAFYREQVARQRMWIEEHGGSLSGYCLRYGEAGDADRYGDGGEAIYEADTAALRRYEAELAQLEGRESCSR